MTDQAQQAPAQGELDSDQGFNADARAARRAQRRITIGGKDYRPRRKTGVVIKLIIGNTPTEEPDENDIQAQQEGVDLLYKQIALLITDAQGMPAIDDDEAIEKLAQEIAAELDMEEARDLMAYLMPGREVGDGKAGDEGNQS